MVHHTQTAFRVRVEHANGTVHWEGVTVRSNRSEAVRMDEWSSDGTTPTLTAATLYFVSVSVTLQESISVLGRARFLTALSSAQFRSFRPLWTPNASTQFALFRRELNASQLGKHAYLSVTARPIPDWNHPHGQNTNHLLGAYKLWVNNVPLGAGPGRMVRGRIAVDTGDISSLLRGGGRMAAVSSLPSNLTTHKVLNPVAAARVGRRPCAGLLAVAR